MAKNKKVGAQARPLQSGDDMTTYTLLDYVQMPITWIVILLVVVVVQLMVRRECINVHVGGGRSYKDILNTGKIS